MGTRKIIVFSILVVLGWSTAAANSAGLTGVQWTLTHVNGREVTNSRAYLEISESEKSFSGSAGCNRMFGDVRINGKRISFARIGTTKMACSATPSVPFEQALLRSLRYAAKYSLTTNQLIIKDRFGSTLLKYKRLVKQPPVVDPIAQPGLGQKKWVLESIKGTEFVKLKDEVFINFDPAKKGVGGNSGCNVFGGDYTVDGKKIKIKDIISTMRACEADGKMSIERKLFDGLRAADRFEIRGEKLHMYRGKDLLLTFHGIAK